jgi:hypothetical protein
MTMTRDAPTASFGDGVALYPSYLGAFVTGRVFDLRVSGHPSAPARSSLQDWGDVFGVVLACNCTHERLSDLAYQVFEGRPVYSSAAPFRRSSAFAAAPSTLSPASAAACANTSRAPPKVRPSIWVDGKTAATAAPAASPASATASGWSRSTRLMLPCRVNWVYRRQRAEPSDTLRLVTSAKSEMDSVEELATS